MSHALSSREHTNHRRRHCAKRATLHARVAADCTSDASASASDENSAAQELHEPMVPLARERPPDCARTAAGAGCRPVVNRTELAAFGPSMRPGAMPAVACASPDKERSKLFDRPSSEPALVSDPARFGALKPTPLRRRPEHDSGRYGDSAVERIAEPRPEEVHRAPRFAARAQRGSIPGATSLAIRSICCRSPPIGQR